MGADVPVLASSWAVPKARNLLDRDGALTDEMCRGHLLKRAAMWLNRDCVVRSVIYKSCKTSELDTWLNISWNVHSCCLTCIYGSMFECSTWRFESFTQIFSKSGTSKQMKHSPSEKKRAPWPWFHLKPLVSFWSVPLKSDSSLTGCLFRFDFVYVFKKRAACCQLKDCGRFCKCAAQQNTRNVCQSLQSDRTCSIDHPVLLIPDRSQETKADRNPRLMLSQVGRAPHPS
jgi:hypothetical protein